MPNSAPIFNVSENDMYKSFTKRDLARIIFKHKVVILCCFLGVTVLVAAGLLYLPPTYQAEARVMIKTEQQRKPSFFSGIAAYREPEQSDPVNRKIETEMELIETEPLSAEVVRTMHLQYDQVFHKAYVHFLNLLGDLYDQMMENMFNSRNPGNKYGFTSTTAAFRKSIVVEPLKSKTSETNSNIIRVALSAPNPEIAQKSLILLLEYYVSLDSRQNEEAGQKAYEILKKERDETYRNVIEAQGAMRQFLSQRGTTRRIGGNSGILGSNADYDPQSMKQSSMTVEGPTTGQSSADNNVDPSMQRLVTSPKDDSSITMLKSKLIELELNLLDLQRTFSDKSENIQTLKKSIANLKNRIAKEINKSALDETSLLTLQRNIRLNEALYIDLNKKLSQISLFLQMNREQYDNRVIIEPPSMPNSSDWKKKLIFEILGALGGLALGFVVAGFREYTDHTFKTPEDVNTHLGLETLAIIPFAAAKDVLKKGVTISQVQSNLYKLCIRILAKFDIPADKAEGKDKGKVIMVTSAKEGEGKTFIANSLALYAATLRNEKILLVDFNLESPELQSIFNCPDREGLSEGLIHNKWSENLFSDSPFANLKILPAGNNPNPELLFKQQPLEQFLAYATKQFDWLIFDCTSIGKTGVNNLTLQADGVIFVIDSEKTRREVVQDAIANMDIEKKRILGVVLNNQIRYIPRILYNNL
jgi:polysaccharide biosynthesis transport protein